jgi:hypothetical protein
MKRPVCLIFSLVTLLTLNATAVRAQAKTQPGLFFTIANNCSTPVSGFAVGDELCLLQAGSATFKRAIFHGTMYPGQQEFAMACTGKDGLGSIIFVPSGGSASPIVLPVKPDQVISIPRIWCGTSKVAPETLFKQPG